MSVTCQSPFATKDRNIYIVNTNYNHYGQSVVLPQSMRSGVSSHSTLSHQGSNHSNKRQRLERQSIDSFEDQVIELNADSMKALKPKIFNYRSLINPDFKVKRFLTKLDSDAFSLFSSTSKAQSSPVTVNALPVELLRLVVSYCDDYKTKVSCLYVNQNFYHATKPLVYETPLLTSSYRVAQLISSLKEYKNGDLIKCLDLSKLSPGVITRDPELDSLSDEEEPMGPEVLEYAMASWRDWKYRDDPLYGSAMLNSYTLSKSKSSMSYDSNASVGSSFHKILSKWRIFLPFEDIESMKRKVVKWRRKLYHEKRPKLEASIQLDRKVIEKHVNFSLSRDPNNQPFVSSHPYTNRFLLKYAGLKDLPIGYILYFLEMCPFLKELDIGQLTLSSDFAIVTSDKPRIPSLIDTVLGSEVEESETAHYLSDSNVYFKMKSYHESQFIKLYEIDILKYLTKLCYLESLSLSSLTWLNYKNMRSFVLNSQALNNGSLTKIDLTNSGMIRDLKWAKFFDAKELKDYFKDEFEKIAPLPENQTDTLARTIGMVY